MSDLPAGFQMGDLYCYPYGRKSDATFGYIPGPPHVELNSNGVLSANLLTSPRAAVLSLQAVWTATAEDVAKLQEEIQKRYPDAKNASLKIAPLADAEASLSVTDADEQSFTFGPNRASQTESNRVVFSESLKSAEKLAALKAFQGQAGALKLTCTGKLALHETISARISGDLATEIKALAPKKKSGGLFSWKEEAPALPDLAACSAAVDRALGAGQLKIMRDETPNVSAELRAKVEADLKKSASKTLFDKIQQLGQDAAYMSSFAIDLAATESEEARFTILREADLGKCFANNRGAGLVSQAAADLAEPAR